MSIINVVRSATALAGCANHLPIGEIGSSAPPLLKANYNRMLVVSSAFLASRAGSHPRLAKVQTATWKAANRDRYELLRKKR